MDKGSIKIKYLLKSGNRRDRGRAEFHIKYGKNIFPDFERGGWSNAIFFQENIIQKHVFLGII